MKTRKDRVQHAINQACTHQSHKQERKTTRELKGLVMRGAVRKATDMLDGGVK